MRMFSKVLLASTLVLGLLFPLAAPQPARAEVEYGYLWSLYFDFEQSFDGVLTIEVGPWENGNLVSVDETSTATVTCNRVGSVGLNGGDAVFSGGYLKCSMDLGKTVWNNHKLSINAIDSYGSMQVRTRLNSAVSGVAPVFTHPNAVYGVDFSQTFAATPSQQLWNGVGPMQATFPGVTANTWNNFGYQYRCISNGGPCDATFWAGPQTQTMPTAGSRVQFSTGPTTFEIGRNGGVSFTGRMASLLVDPGNTGH